MAKKPHKFADNHVEISTLLTEADLRAICARAAVESTGDLWNGMQRVTETGSGEHTAVYLVKDALTGWSKLMSFVVEFGSRNHKTTLSTTINTYMTSRPTAYGIPVGPNRMVAHHTYVQFITKIANTVRIADATANVTLVDGSSAQPASHPVPVGSRAAAPAAPWAAGDIETAPVAVPVVATAAAPLLSTLSPVPPSSLAAAEALEATKVVVRVPRGKATWFVQPDGLARIPVTASISFGRDPRGSGEASETLLSVPPTEWTVSKTHARLRVTDGVLYVTDLDSTNGTFLIDEHEDMVQCEPNVAKVVPFGSGLELGAYAITIDREAGARS